MKIYPLIFGYHCKKVSWGYRQILINVTTMVEYGFHFQNQHDILIHFVIVLQRPSTVWRFKNVPRQIASQRSWIFIHTFCTITLTNTGSHHCLYLSPCTCTAWSKNAHFSTAASMECFNIKRKVFHHNVQTVHKLNIPIHFFYTVIKYSSQISSILLQT